MTFVPPAEQPEEYYAALPWSVAQAKLGETPPVPRSARRLTAAWHHTSFDAHRGSIMIVNSTKLELLDLVGERVRITYSPLATRPRVAYATVLTAKDLDDDDISLSRRVYAALSLLSVPMIDVRVEVLQGAG